MGGLARDRTLGRHVMIGPYAYSLVACPGRK